MSASEQQILEALPMVRRMASRYSRTRLGADDALGVGALALVEAGTRYDQRRGVPFTGYAFWRVRGAMRDAYRGRAGSTVGGVEAEVPCDPDVLAELVSNPVAAHSDGRLDLLSAIACLSCRLRTVVLQHAAGVPHGEIARTLDVHESRVSQLLGTARARLRFATALE